eukprot:scaffold17497_cov67-Phaeocystis_antarctica.AAC.1
MSSRPSVAATASGSVFSSSLAMLTALAWCGIICSRKVSRADSSSGTCISLFIAQSIAWQQQGAVSERTHAPHRQQAHAHAKRRRRGGSAQVGPVRPVHTCKQWSKVVSMAPGTKRSSQAISPCASLYLTTAVVPQLASNVDWLTGEYNDNSIRRSVGW